MLQKTSWPPLASVHAKRRGVRRRRADVAEDGVAAVGFLGGGPAILFLAGAAAQAARPPFLREEVAGVLAPARQRTAWPSLSFFEGECR